MSDMYVIMVGSEYLVGRGDMQKDYWISKENAERKKRIKTNYIFSSDISRALRTNMPEKYIKALENEKFSDVCSIPA
ncbi:hypothetical protein [Culicoidibacter larvae]|uniref:Uncharacterized protein n=1 Tax=Culicoidibacter larvae TaxID=2579976 RepID=A0A5R8QHY8_9FIRM|nr:hypothetical protein [Culicoidibacter larvae]TLG77336.1 hypothetical protein FEZ08_01580 [Culicoidibacter larvae]